MTDLVLIKGEGVLGFVISRMAYAALVVWFNNGYKFVELLSSDDYIEIEDVEVY